MDIKPKYRALSGIMDRLEDDIDVWISRNGRTLARTDVEAIRAAVCRKAEGMLILCSAEELLECGPVISAVIDDLQIATVKLVRDAAHKQTVTPLPSLLWMC